MQRTYTHMQTTHSRSPTHARLQGGQTDVMVVGCGLPKRGMGWFHSLQMLNGECPSAKVGPCTCICIYMFMCVYVSC